MAMPPMAPVDARRFPLIRQHSARQSSECFICADPVGHRAGEIDDLRMGCGCATHYKCLVAYLQAKIGDRANMNLQGVACPYGAACCSHLSDPSPTGRRCYYITLEDLDNVAAYRTPEKAAVIDALLAQNNTPPLTTQQVAELRKWLEEQDLQEALRAWLGDVTISFDEMSELVKIGERRNGNFVAAVRARGDVALSAALAADLTAHVEAMRKGYLQMDPFVLATTKACPTCTVRSTHFHGHQCHHISPTTNGCPSCHIGFCYRCLATEIDNRQIRGSKERWVSCSLSGAAPRSICPLPSLTLAPILPPPLPLPLPLPQLRLRGLEQLLQGDQDGCRGQVPRPSQQWCSL